MPTQNEITVLTSADLAAAETAIDRALVAFFTGHARGADGNGGGFAPAWDQVDVLARRGWIKTEAREGCCTPLVWLTEEGHEVIGDIDEEGDFHAHVAHIRAAVA